MADLLGFTSIAIVSFITLLIALRWTAVSNIIFVALAVRVLFMLIGHYIIPLPDSMYDAAGFEWGAWDRAKDGFINVINNFPGVNSFFYQWMVAIPYSLFGRSILMMQSIGLLFGVGTVFLGWLVSKKLWDNHTANKVGWVLALFPSLVLYSVITLREVYISFFLLVAIFGIVNWIKIGNYKSFLIAMFGFISATFFHGALLIGGIIFIIILALNSFKRSFKLLMVRRINIQDLIIISLVFFLSAFYLINNIHLPYIGTFEQVTDIGWLKENVRLRMRGDASYSDWININSPVELIYKSFIRVLFFLFSPFPWDISKPIHLIGLFDSILYMILTYLIFLNRKIIWKDRALRIILIILVCYLFVFGLGVSNFGAGVRHRSKFVIELILLAAPLLPSFVFSKKIKYKEYNK
jgi:hypothetical protein